jgi:hypothetical protein
MVISAQERSAQRIHNSLLIALITLLATSWITGCGGKPKPSSDEIRKRLRQNADGATADISRKRPLQRQRSESTRRDSPRVDQRPRDQAKEVQDQLPAHVSCLNKIACFSKTHYLVAEGLGANVREAEIDGSSRLSAKISSEVSSTVRLRTSEGDGQQSKTQGEIEQTVKSNFKRGELIKFIGGDPLENADKQTRVRVFAYLPKYRYQEEVERELERPLRTLASTVKSLQTEDNPEVFVRVWQDLVVQRNIVEEPLLEYRAVVGGLPKTYQEIKPLLVSLEREADRRRRKAHFVIEFSGAELGQHKMRTLLKGLIRKLGPRVSSPGTCLRGNYLMKVESAVEDQVHQLTGGVLKKLRWGVTMYECGTDAQDLREIGQQAFPVISGVERYNVSADQVLVRQLKTFIDLSKSPTKSKSKRLRNQLNEVRDTINGLVSLVVPTL